MSYQIKSKYSKDEIIVDGSLTNGIWKDLQEVELSYYDGKRLPQEWETKVKSFWTEKNLYFGFNANFDALKIAKPDSKMDDKGKTLELWDVSDVFEIFIGPDSRNTRKYRELQVGPDSRWIDLTLDASGPERQADFTWTSGMTAKSKFDMDKKTWTAVFQIPFTAFSHVPKENEIWNLNFYRISGDNRVHMAWSPVMVVRFHLPEKYGDILFVKE